MKALAGATIVTPDLDAAIAAYGEFLGYNGEEERVGDERAAAWGCPEAASARIATLYPKSHEARFIRLIEGDLPRTYKPMLFLGWNAVEIIVQDLDALAARLASSPFEIIGPPATLDLGFTDQIRAMQVVGLGKEVLYLTQVEGQIPGFDLPVPRSFVGQPFIMVLGGISIEQAEAPYAQLGRPAGPHIDSRIDILSEAYDVPRETKFTLSTIALDEQSLIELDALPSKAGQRPRSTIGLPAGIAAARFRADALAPAAEAIRIGQYQENGRTIHVLRGNSGELIELEISYKDIL